MVMKSAHLRGAVSQECVPFEALTQPSPIWSSSPSFHLPRTRKAEGCCSLQPRERKQRELNRPEFSGRPPFV